MKKMTTILILSTILLFSFSSILAQEELSAEKHTYIGVKRCGMCHKKEDAGQQLKLWKDSKHADAFKTLQTAESDSIATALGFKTKAAETHECLVCHATGYDLDPSMLGKRFKIEDGVQCESCHGPGSSYKTKKIMKDSKKAFAKGLIEFKDDAAIEASCVACHNEDSPTYKPFDFEKSWKEIYHPTPTK